MHLLVFSLLLAAAARSEAAAISQHIPEERVVADETALEEYFDDLRGDKVWPTGPAENARLVVEDQNLLTTPKAHAVEEDPKPKESSMWKIALVGAILLMSLLGTLSLAYYMCVWRGGRIHYDLQKDVSV